jgi:hypothetical protein
MKRYCQWCRRGLRLRDVRCRYCRDTSVSWLHATVAAAAAVTFLFFLTRVM